MATTVIDPLTGRLECPHGIDCKQYNQEEHRTAYLHPCKYFPNCTRMGDLQHINQYSHAQAVKKKEPPPLTGEPQLCAFGEQCRRCGDDAHLDRFLHSCKFGGKCKKINDAQHLRRFLHLFPSYPSSSPSSSSSSNSSSSSSSSSSHHPSSFPHAPYHHHHQHHGGYAPYSLHPYGANPYGSLEYPYKMCTVCYSKYANMALMPCGHSGICSTCGENAEKCPLCQEVVLDRVLTY